MSTISTLSSTYWQSLLGLNSQTTTGTTTSSCGGSSTGSGSSISDILNSGSSTSDNVQLSPFAVELLGTLQQLQQSNPKEYKSAMSQISTKLEDASATATADGNTAAANQLSQLATDFTSASQSGSLPNLQDLLQALGGSGNVSSSGYAPPPPPFFSSDVSASSGTDSSTSGAPSITGTSARSTATSNSTVTVNDITPEILASLQASSNLSSSFNPMNIIMDTLSSTEAIDSNS